MSGNESDLQSLQWSALSKRPLSAHTPQTWVSWKCVEWCFMSWTISIEHIFLLSEPDLLWPHCDRTGDITEEYIWALVCFGLMWWMQPILEPRRNDLLLGQKLNAALGTFTLQSTYSHESLWDATLRFIISCTNYYISFNHIILMLLEAHKERKVVKSDRCSVRKAQTGRRLYWLLCCGCQNSVVCLWSADLIWRSQIPCVCFPSAHMHDSRQQRIELRFLWHHPTSRY